MNLAFITEPALIARFSPHLDKSGRPRVPPGSTPRESRRRVGTWSSPHPDDDHDPQACWRY
ncbi:MAG: hypothetical protein ACRD3V_20285 [Vicinamibacteria bacterium]